MTPQGLDQPGARAACVAAWGGGNAHCPISLQRRWIHHGKAERHSPRRRLAKATDLVSL
jgi:hypothetical protein